MAEKKKPNRTCLIGLVDAGKSTALAALWFSVTEKSELCDWYLPNSNRPTNSSRWFELRNRWLSGTKLERTEHEAHPGELRLKLKKSGSDGENEIIVPDIAGEDYEKIYEIGRFPKMHASIVSSSNHLVLFVRIKDYDHPVRLTAPSSDKGTEESEISATKWMAESMYPGSKNIAMVRGIMSLVSAKPQRITVVLSAWDLAPEDSSPEKELKKRFPLLFQYLHTNFDYELVGLSAQGYDYDDVEASSNVTLDDISRISVVGKIAHNDITRVFA